MKTRRSERWPISRSVRSPERTTTTKSAPDQRRRCSGAPAVRHQGLEPRIRCLSDNNSGWFTAVQCRLSDLQVQGVEQPPASRRIHRRSPQKVDQESASIRPPGATRSSRRPEPSTWTLDPTQPKKSTQLQRSTPYGSRRFALFGGAVARTVSMYEFVHLFERMRLWRSFNHSNNRHDCHSNAIPVSVDRMTVYIRTAQRGCVHLAPAG